MHSNEQNKAELPKWRAFIARLRRRLRPGRTESGQGASNAPEHFKRSAIPRRSEIPRRARERIPYGGRRIAIESRRKPQNKMPMSEFSQMLPESRAYLRSLAVQVHRVNETTTRHSVSLIQAESYSMRGWEFYFLAKLGLYSFGLIGFHAWENLLFGIFVIWSLPSRIWRRVKVVITAVLAVTMLYYDSWLPPVTRLFKQASSLSGFSLPYLFELIGRFLNLSVVVWLAAVLLVGWLASRWMRMGTLLIAVIAILAIAQSPLRHVFDYMLNGGDQASASEVAKMDRHMQDFFEHEAQRSVVFSAPRNDAVPFDVIFLHVCSLSWDDVRAVGLEDHPLWKRFDILFTQFNSAASYSGPAAIHLLRATCGQQEHGKMYQPVPEKCYLMNSLLRSGFESNVALNHDGKFDDFLDQVQTHGRLIVPALSQDGTKIAQYAFDGSPVYDDLSMLNRWLESRKQSTNARVALYYNTVSLHDGNHLSGKAAISNSLDTYKLRLSTLLDEIESFMDELEKSGSRAVVVMIPEHGAAVHGDKQQIAGLREIPTPAISLVPVGIKVVGRSARREGNALSIDSPVSYLAMSHVVSRMLEMSPFDRPSFDPSDYITDLPTTRFVSQNEKMTVAEYNDRYYLSRDGSKWEDYTEFNSQEESR